MHDTDRRVIYTKKILRSSLMKLLEEKSIGRISVTELCNAAGVNRGTFYSHYRQPEDVMHQIENELISQIEEVLEKESDMVEIHKRILSILENHRSECRVLVGPNGDDELMQRILGISAEYFKRTWQAELNISDEKTHYVHTFLFAGTAEVIKEWIINDDSRTSEDIMEIINGIHKSIFMGGILG